MPTDHLKGLAAAKAKVAELEKTLVTERHQTLVNLPVQPDYGSLKDLIAAQARVGVTGDDDRLTLKSHTGIAMQSPRQFLEPIDGLKWP
jgi:predicted nucleic acid-binding protein